MNCTLATTCIIYKIYNDIDGDTYVGSTTQPPSQRLSRHTSKSKTISSATGKLRQSNLYVKMRLIGPEHFFIEVIEHYTYIGDKTERFVLEQDWIDILQSNLNQRKTFLTDEERKEQRKEKDRKWYERNKEQIKEYSKKYYEENKEQIIEQCKKQYICLVCNRTLTLHGKVKHERSKRHTTNLNNLQKL